MNYATAKPVFVRPGTGVIAVSQSDETADTIASVQEMGRQGALLIGLVKGVGSTTDRITEVGKGLPCRIGKHRRVDENFYQPELYAGHACPLAWPLRTSVGGRRYGNRGQVRASPCANCFRFGQAGRIREIAAPYTHCRDCLFIGRTTIRLRLRTPSNSGRSPTSMAKGGRRVR